MGTTVTAQIVAFKVTQYAWLMIAVGFAMNSVAKRNQYRHYGLMLLGLGLLFIGMEQMSTATDPLRSYEPFVQLMEQMDRPLWGILLGALFTAVVQSSSATTGIVIMLASQGFLSLEAGIALAIGANIGTCFTAVLSAIGKPPEAVRAAVVHVLFNVIGAAAWLYFIPELAEMARSVSPAFADLSGTARLAAETPRQVANANTIFNVANTLVLIWFTTPIARLAERLVPERPQAADGRIQPKYLERVYLGTPSLALDRIRLELGRMGELVKEMVERAPQAVLSGTRQELESLVAMEHDSDRLYVALLEYARELRRDELTSSESKRFEELIHVSNRLEGMGELVKTNLVAQGLRRLELDLQFSPQTQQILQPFGEMVSQAVATALQAFDQQDVEKANSVVVMKSRSNQMAHEAIDHLAKRLLADEPNRVELFRIETEIVGSLRRIFDNARRIAQYVTQQTQSGKKD